MENLKKMACLPGLAALLLLSSLTPVSADRDRRDARDYEIRTMPNPFGTPGRSSVLRPGPVPSAARTERRSERRYHRNGYRRSWRENRRWNNRRRPYYWRR